MFYFFLLTPVTKEREKSTEVQTQNRQKRAAKSKGNNIYVNLPHETDKGDLGKSSLLNILMKTKSI